jgi:flagellar basal body-associated protein FliL
MSNANSSLRKKLIVLIVIIVVLIVAILIAVNMKNNSGSAGAEGAVTTSEEGQGLVVQDEVTVEVDIPEDESGSEEPAEDAAEE